MAVKAQWRFGPQHDSLCVRTVDLILDKEESFAQSLSGYTLVDKLPLVKHLRLSGFFARALESSRNGYSVGIKLIIPACEGYVSRSDMVDFRFTGCESVQSALGLVAPRQHVLSFPPKEEHTSADHLEAIFGATIGALEVKSISSVPAADSLEQLETEIVNRLSIQWLLPTPIPYRRVAIVGCRSENASYETIKAMGIGLIVLDQPGHYLEDTASEFGYLREIFYPIDLNPDAGLVQRIVDVLRGEHLDGIFTRADIYQEKVARAAEVLGLPASPPSAFAVATDKYKARLLEADHNSAVCVSNSDELEERLKSVESPLNLEYPVIIKPCIGRASLGVVRADTEADAVASVRWAQSRVLGYENGKPVQSLIMLESYIDGPEFDVNFALWDGEVLFADVSDNFPCAGDIKETEGAKDFQETMFVLPSALPPNEQDIIASSLRDSVLRMGFRTGVFHVEGRVRHSSMHYTECDGTIDLVPRDDAPKAQPSIFMIEANPRPPAFHGLQATTWTFGVDYYALHVLRSMADEQRYRSFATPFMNGAQYVSGLVLIMPEKGGILKSSDPAIDLRHTRPDLMECIPLYKNIFTQGDYIPSPGAIDMTFVSIIVVNTKKGRSDLLRKAEEIRQEWRVTIE